MVNLLPKIASRGAKLYFNGCQAMRPVVPSIFSMFKSRVSSTSFLCCGLSHSNFRLAVPLMTFLSKSSVRSSAISLITTCVGSA